MQIKSILAIVVTYNIGKEYMKNFISLVDQVDNIIIIDNNSNNETKESLKKIQEIYKQKVKVIFNEKNQGLAKAQNIGIKYAQEIKADWILLLDNDSTLNKNMISIMKEQYLEYNEKEKVAIISPLIVDKNSLRNTKYICKEGFFKFKRKKLDKILTDTVLCTIASGSLIKLQVIQKIGDFKEEYFIDSIDTEFCMRVISNNYKIIVVKNAVLYHELGQRKDYKVLGVTMSPTNHSELRRYYMYRNRLKMWRKYWLKTPQYVFYEISASVYQIILILILEKGKLNKLKMIMKGLKDGLKE